MRLVMAFSFVLAMAAGAAAGPAADIVKRFYTDNIGMEASEEMRHLYTEPALSQFAGNDKAGDAGELGCIDAGLAVSGQDFDEDEIGRSLKLTEKVDGDRATVVARFSNFTQPNEVEWSLRKIGGKWLIADIANPAEGWRFSEFDCTYP